MSVDVVIPADTNLIKKEAEKILKHKDLSAPGECESKSDTGNNKTTGTISKSPTQYLSDITGKHEIKELQTTAILCTAHRLWEVLM
jgi:hypothetical protein